MFNDGHKDTGEFTSPTVACRLVASCVVSFAQACLAMAASRSCTDACCFSWFCIALIFHDNNAAEAQLFLLLAHDQWSIYGRQRRILKLFT